MNRWAAHQIRHGILMAYAACGLTHRAWRYPRTALGREAYDRTLPGLIIRAERKRGGRPPYPSPRHRPEEDRWW